MTIIVIQRWWRDNYFNFTMRRWQKRIEAAKNLTGDLNRSVFPAPRTRLRYSSSGYESWCCPLKFSELRTTPRFLPTLKMVGHRLDAYGFEGKTIDEAHDELRCIQAAVVIQRWIHKINH